MKYLIDGKEVRKKDFYQTLRLDCVKVVSTDVIAGWCGVDCVEFDEKKYADTLRNLREGDVVLFFDRQRTYRYQR